MVPRTMRTSRSHSHKGKCAKTNYIRASCTRSEPLLPHAPRAVTARALVYTRRDASSCAAAVRRNTTTTHCRRKDITEHVHFKLRCVPEGPTKTIIGVQRIPTRAIRQGKHNYLRPHWTMRASHTFRTHVSNPLCHNGRLGSNVLFYLEDNSSRWHSSCVILHCSSSFHCCFG